MKQLIAFIFSFFALFAHAQIEKAIPEPMQPARLVNDFAGILTAEQRDQLEGKLRAYNDSTSNQVAIVIVEDLKGYDASEYAFALGRKWGVGNSNFNNGVVILISTGGGDGNRDAFIATGYGLEGAIPDITAKIIVDSDIIPNFKQGNYYRGLDEATDNIIKAAAGEYKAPEGYGKKKGKGIGLGFLIMIIIILVIISGSGRGGGGGVASRRGFGDFSTGWIIGNILQGMSRGGGGSGGWGGGGGGGFGGFGGGGFGGGGAGGKW